MSFLSQLKDLIRFQALSKDKRGIVFYSEGRPYWKYLGPLIQELLHSSTIPLCYVSSKNDDPGLSFKHENLSTFEIGFGFIRNWLFENLDAKVLVMTMPDLNTFQLKRSKNPVHYVYLQHSMVSCHMVYRKGAFDAFDTIMCGGPHHIKEIRELEKYYDLPKKCLLEHGYVALDEIRKKASRTNRTQTNQVPHILVAPSWGPQALLETCGLKLLDILLDSGFHVTLRPHPQTMKFSKSLMQKIAKLYKDRPNFIFNVDVENQEAFFDADIMISDWSGVALEYAFGLEKPVVFIDVPRKINNPEFMKISIEPFEVWVRDKIGEIISIEQLSDIPRILTNLLKSNSKRKEIQTLRNEYLYNFEKSAPVGAQMLCDIYKRI